MVQKCSQLPRESGDSVSVQKVSVAQLHLDTGVAFYEIKTILICF